MKAGQYLVILSITRPQTYNLSVAQASADLTIAIGNGYNEEKMLRLAIVELDKLIGQKYGDQVNFSGTPFIQYFYCKRMRKLTDEEKEQLG